jgi:methionine-rich copper-binding protein CopC
MQRALACGTILAFLLLAAPTGGAHASLSESLPASRSHLAVPPPNITLTFTQPVLLDDAILNLTDLHGARHETSLRLGVDGHILVADLVNPLDDGVYRVDWSATSSLDGHRSEGSFGFAVGELSVQQGTHNPWLDPPELVGRLLLGVALGLAMAGLAWGLGLQRTGYAGLLQRISQVAWPVALAATLVLLGAASARASAPLASWLTDPQTRGPAAAVLIAVAGVITTSARTSRAAATRLGSLLITLLVIAASWSPEGAQSALAGAAHTLSSAYLLGLLALPVLFHALGMPQGVEPWPARRWAARLALGLATALLTGVAAWVLAPRTGGTPLAASELLLFKIGAAGFLVAAVLVQLAPTGRASLEGNRLSRLAVPSLVFVLLATGLGAAVSAQIDASSKEPPVFLAAGEGDEFNVTVRIQPTPIVGAFSTVTVQVVGREDGVVETENTCGRPRGCLLLELVWPSQRHADEEETGGEHHGEHIILEPLGDGFWEARNVLFLEAGTHEFVVEIQTGYVFLDSVSFEVATLGHSGH